MPSRNAVEYESVGGNSVEVHIRKKIGTDLI